MGIMDDIRKRLAANPKRVVFPEGTSPRIIAAAAELAKGGVAYPVLVGDPEEVEEIAAQEGIDLCDVLVKGLPGEDEATMYVDAYEASGGMLSRKGIARRLKDPLNYAAMMVWHGEADVMIAGVDYSTANVVLASQTLIGMAPGISTPSSMILMETPGFSGPEGELMVLADIGACVKPTPSQLADIAIATAGSAQSLLAWEPRVAMLSFSTKGSVQSDETEAVLEAVRLVNERRPDLAIDGELQLDAAIVPEVAAKKAPGDSPVAGRANVLVFPDLNAGNICYKAIQRFAGAKAYGPLLQGFAKPVSDLSRGSSVDDIVGVTMLACLCS